MVQLLRSLLLSITKHIMIQNVQDASKLDLLIADTQGIIKYTVLPTQKPDKKHLWLTSTKGLRTNTNRGGQTTPHAQHIR